MPLAKLIAATVPDFEFAHYQDHLEIVQAINSQRGLKLTVYPMYPIAKDNDQWKAMHQAFHDDMAKAIGTVTTDLSNENDPNWVYRNYQQHLQARTILRI